MSCSLVRIMSRKSGLFKGRLNKVAILYGREECRTFCNGHLALRPSEQIGWQGRKRSRAPVAWREQAVNKKQRFLSSFQIEKGISCRQLVAPALEDILRWRMNIYCDGEWIYTAMADEYILRWQMNIYCDGRWRYTAMADEDILRCRLNIYLTF